MKPKLLAICAQNPSEFARQAGHGLAFRFLRQLAEEYDTDLFLIINKSDEVDYNLKSTLGLNDLRVFKLGRLQKAFSVLLHFFSVPPRFATRIANAPLKEISQRLNMGVYDEIYYEFSQAGVYHHLLSPTVKSVISCHDIQTQVALRGRGVDALLAAYVFRYEKKLLSSIDEVRVLSAKDKQLLSALFSIRNGQCVKLPVTNYVDLLHDKASIRREPFSMLFWGAMNRKENEEAVLCLIKDIMPSVVERYPKCKLYIVGNAPSKKLLSYESDNIVIVGFVENPAEYFLRASLGVVPLIRGAGIKFKTLEMLVAGMKVISTPVGAEGIEEDSRLKVVELEFFKDSILGEFGNESG